MNNYRDNQRRLTRASGRGRVVVRPPGEHRVNYGRLYPAKTFKADCTCGWVSEGEREKVVAAVRRHEETYIP